MICSWCQGTFTAQVKPWTLFALHPPAERPCSTCRRQFSPLGKHRCQQCGRELQAGGLCQDCRRWQRQYRIVLKNRAVWHYNSGLHELMTAYKRYGDYELHAVLQELASPVTKLNADCFVPVPSSPEHLARRKFDTIEAVFAPLLPLTKVLGKRAGGGAQGEKNRLQRLQTQQSFFVKDDAPRLSGKILLLDDIYTTGRTLYHARDALLAANPDCQISSFTIAR